MYVINSAGTCRSLIVWGWWSTEAKGAVAHKMHAGWLSVAVWLRVKSAAMQRGTYKSRNRGQQDKAFQEATMLLCFRGACDVSCSSRAGLLACRHEGVCGQEGLEVGLHADGPHARAAAAVGDAEGLVQVQVAHIRTDDARRRQADLQAMQLVAS